jgi:hypothetical protein
LAAAGDDFDRGVLRSKSISGLGSGVVLGTEGRVFANLSIEIDGEVVTPRATILPGDASFGSEGGRFRFAGVVLTGQLPADGASEPVALTLFATATSRASRRADGGLVRPGSSRERILSGTFSPHARG